MKRKLSVMLGLVLAVGIVGCTPSENIGEEIGDTQIDEQQVVNVYTDRHYDTDDELYQIFTEKTGVDVNIIKADSDELIERLSREGLDSNADVLISTDAARLYTAKEKDLLKELEGINSKDYVTANLEYDENFWIPLTIRGRVIVYSLDRVNPDELSTYEDLTNEKWKGKVLVRSSSNVYNQSLLSSFIELYGEETTKEWAEGIVENMARTPQGNDRDQVKAIASGIGDVAIVNTYYIGKLLNSLDEEEVKAGQQVGVFFPNQDTTGTHINISGIGITKSSKNTENAKELIKFLISEEAQGKFADANYEYPVNTNVQVNELLSSWGEFKSQEINLSKLGENKTIVTKIFDQVGWK